jgi:hypothetical protein
MASSLLKSDIKNTPDRVRRIASHREAGAHAFDPPSDAFSLTRVN